MQNVPGKEYTAMMLEKRKELIGKVVNGFKIVGVISSNNGKRCARFIAECIICGSRRIRTILSIGYRNHVMYPSQKFACDIVERIKEIQKIAQSQI